MSQWFSSCVIRIIRASSDLPRPSYIPLENNMEGKAGQHQLTSHSPCLPILSASIYKRGDTWVYHLSRIVCPPDFLFRFFNFFSSQQPTKRLLTMSLKNTYNKERKCNKGASTSGLAWQLNKYSNARVW